MTSTPNQRFPKSLRLLKREEFDRVFAVKCSTADGRIIVYGAANQLEHARIGLVVSRKIGNAVVRNRWKRLLREGFRLSRTDLPPTLDIVVLPKQGVTPDLQGLRQSLVELSRRIAKRVRRGAQELLPPPIPDPQSAIPQ